MNIDLQKLRESAEKLIEQGSGDWFALTDYWNSANPQTIIALCNVVEAGCNVREYGKTVDPNREIEVHEYWKLIEAFDKAVLALKQ